MRRRKEAFARLILALALVGGAFGYGFLCAKRGLFPHDLLVRLGRSGSDAPAKKGVETRFDKGWFERDHGAAGAQTPQMLEDLDKLGYSQSYQAAGTEYGVVVDDPSRACPGLNLVVSAHEPCALLVDMQGRTLHEWRFAYEDVPEPPGFEPSGTFGMRYWRKARLLPGGDLLAIYDRTGLIRIDRDSHLEWSLSGGYHHDLDVTADGTIWVLQHDVKVIPRIHPTKPTFEDFIVHLTPDGQVLERLSLLEAFEHSRYAPLLEHRKEAGDIFHTNALEIFEAGEPSRSPLWSAGRALVSIWGLDAIAIVDLGRNEVCWALTGMWHRQHDPVLLENGHLLLFDNLGLGEKADLSRVLEIDPLSQELAWSYVGTPENGFSSALIGTNQRLANGNTLITESLAGNAFEVDPAGETVWRYRSPYRVGPNGEGVAVLMEVERLAPDAVSGWLPADR